MIFCRIDYDYWFDFENNNAVFVNDFNTVYWTISSREAPTGESENKSRYVLLEKIFIYFGEIFIVVNVLGVSVLRFDNLLLKFFGLIMLLIGFVEAMAGRIALGATGHKVMNIRSKKIISWLITGFILISGILFTEECY